MSKHTPGPWAVDDDGIVYRKAVARHDYIKLASAWVEGAWVGSDGDEESRANARLISAAPELLAIVSKLALLREGLENGSSSAEHAATRLALDAVAVVAKATGGAA